MSLFRRLSATITGGLEQAINQIENQDAVVEAIVKEARQELAKAKVRLGRVQTDAKQMARKQAELELAVQQWTLRAQRSGAVDQGKAIECLRQRKSCAAQKAELSIRIEQHEVILKRLASDVHLADGRVTEVLNKQHLMRTRESAANAMRGVNAIESTVVDDLSATFERWEIKVTETEMMGGAESGPIGYSSLENEFSSLEEEDELNQQLVELLSESATEQEKGNE